MSIDELIQNLSVQIYKEPLVHVRDEATYPNLENPLHVTVLLLDCDTEIDVNGIFGFLENRTGSHLQKTIEALREIGAPKCAEILDSVKKCMDKYSVTWNRLRSDFKSVTEDQISSFRKLHGDTLNGFPCEVSELAGNFSLFNNLRSPEDAYTAFVNYLEGQADKLQAEIVARLSRAK